jgi:hypothetical protein
MALGMTLSAVNLVGVTATLFGLGGLGEWSGVQFLGLFGVLEAATGIAFVIGPNIWRLPVAEAKLGDGPHDVRFAASTIFIPHWAGGVKVIPGVALAGWAAAQEGYGPATLGLLPLMLLAAAAVVGLSMVLARIGVAKPQFDVYEIVVRRPGHHEFTLPGVSLGGAVMELLLSIVTFPAVKLLAPPALYRPELGPSPVLLVWSGVAGVALLAAGAMAWHGRLAWRAPGPQQREAEAFVEGR